MTRSQFRAALLGQASFAILTLAAPASAQEAAPSGGGVSEVVVTATRQTSTVNRVSLSVAAVTQQALDQTGIKQTSDITRLVPGLNFTSSGVASNVGSFAIRGIVGGTGAATTGVYLDDTALTKRSNNGVQQNNGAPLPILFDLERVEVLKGPQGTLFGGSSQGGTVRFITPEPSLTKFSGTARTEVDTVNMGGVGYEFGAAVGGPIVHDKLGFRVSGMVRETPGWIDAVNAYTNQTVQKQANRIDDGAVHAEFKWQATSRLNFILSTYWTQDREASQVSSPTLVYSPTGNGQLAAPNAVFSTPSVCINTQTRNSVTQPIIAYNPALGVNQAPAGTAVQPATCTAATPAAAQYTRPAASYGPFRTGANVYLMTNNQTLQPSTTRTDVHSITANYDFGPVTAKVISSYLRDNTHNEQSQGAEDPTQRQSLTSTPVSSTGAPVTGFPLFALDPDYAGHFVAANKRTGYQEELRLSSNTPDSRLSWVAGVYYSHQDTHIQYIIPDRNMEREEQLFWGVSVAQRLGITQLPSLGINGVGLYESITDAHFTDKELAGYGEGNLYITSKLKLTGGVRVSQVGLDYSQYSYGVNGSRYPNSAGAFVSGTTTDTPVTPKVGLTYEFTKSDLVYFTAAKGFRAGGVNSPVSPALCATGLAQFGITYNQVPASFKPDEVTSYELGGKFRLLENRLQLNGALYRIDWTNIQSTFTIPGCGQTFVQNGGTARSQGVDLQVQYRPIAPLNLAVNAGYDDAKYLQAVVGPAGAVAGVRPSINAGDHFAVPVWQLSSSGQYDFNLYAHNLYYRVDYQWQSGYTNPGSFGVSVYSPYTLYTGARSNTSMRLGVKFESFDVNAYVNNLLDVRDKVGNAGNGIGGCPATSVSCGGFSTYNPFVGQAIVTPRTIGLQANYRF